ncbi:hypothetical protein [Rhizobium herbae]|uniref:Uncharacterized protein n=1 Tax=Rhizobium herbae TaxID=508661 RepID=A0ABS4EPA7_9HYPH|nr:hypothetical protein [Rhizobium herbae]MBP1859775.1 hypothetical protein [Rhizobium herbae]
MTNLKATDHPADDGRSPLLATDATNPAEARWKAEWEGSANLQEEYPTAGGYVATMKRQAINVGIAAVHAGRATATPVKASPETEARWKADWEASAKLQAEYPTVGSYVAIMKRQAR